MQTKPRRTVLGFRLLTVVIGLLLLLIIGAYSIRTDNFEGEQNFASRVDYIKDQCDDYTSLSLATESKKHAAHCRGLRAVCAIFKPAPMRLRRRCCPAVRKTTT